MFGSLFIIGWNPSVTCGFGWGGLLEPNISKPKLFVFWGGGWFIWGDGWGWLLNENPPWFETWGWGWTWGCGWGGEENPNPIKSIPPPELIGCWTGGCGWGGWFWGEGAPKPRRSPPNPVLLGGALTGWGCVGCDGPVSNPIRLKFWFAEGWGCGGWEGVVSTNEKRSPDVTGAGAGGFSSGFGSGAVLIRSI